EDKRRYFPKIARGEGLGAFSLSEPDAGSDLANVSCRATREGDQWVINGSKTWCTFADGADYIVLFARTSPSPDPKRRHVGISQFLIPKERGSFRPESAARRSARSATSAGRPGSCTSTTSGSRPRRCSARRGAAFTR